MSATTTTPVLSRTLARTAALRGGLESESSSAPRRAAASVLTVLALVATTVLVLMGALLGGRSFVAAADGEGLVQLPVAVVSTTGSTTEERVDVTTSRED